MIIKRSYGQVDVPAEAPALGVPSGVSLATYFWVAVGAGVTVWVITRFLDGTLRR